MASTDELKVYLDHLIPRENLRYKRSREISAMSKDAPELRMIDLYLHKVETSSFLQ